MKHCVFCMAQAEGDVCPYCGKAASSYTPAPHHLQPGTVLGGKYLVGRSIGEGGFGITYVGRDMTLDLKIAIKEYYPVGVVNRVNTYSADISVASGDPEAFFEKGKTSFLSEARTLAKFASEQSVVTVRDFFEANNTAYIVMDFLEGVDLRGYMKNRAPLSFRETYELLSPAMSALAKMHRAGLIHRDISPSNIMMTENGVKLLDFGAARDFNMAGEKSMSIMLKPGFAPEEQYRTKGHQGPWTDVYALSATMYKLMTGKTPVDAMNRVFEDELVAPSSHNGNITDLESAVILKGMAIQAENRYQSIEELQAACEAAMRGETVTDDDDRTVTMDERTVCEPETVYGTGTHSDIPVYVKSERSAPAVQKAPPVHTAPTPRAEIPVKQEQKPAPKAEPKPADGAKQKAEPRPAPAASPAAPMAEKPKKKPNITCFVLSIIFAIASMSQFLAAYETLSDPWAEQSDSVPYFVMGGLFIIACAVCGYFYFPRVDHTKKPNKVCFVFNLIFTFSAAVTAIVGAASFESTDAEAGTGETLILFAVFFAIFSLLFGFFFYPRLSKAGRSKALKIHVGGVLAVVAVLIGVVVFTAASTVTIGDQNIKKNAEEVDLNLDILTDRDIEKLKELPNLKSLYIFECFLDDADVKIIGELTTLESLTLTANTDITDVSPLAKLTNLTYLNITNTNVTDISSLITLTNLKQLYINNTKIENLSMLKEFSNLTNIYMNNIEGLDPSTITMPANVEVIECNGNGITDISFMGSVNAEVPLWLTANNNEITDLSPLAKFGNIACVNINNNSVSDLSPVAKESLYKLTASGNAIEDISCISVCENLSEIDLSYNNISDIGALADKYDLVFLYLSHNAVSDISVLSENFRISTLDLSYNSISDVSALATVDSLSLLNLRSNTVSDISPLAACTNLAATATSLDLRDNLIADVSPLASFAALTNLYLSGNSISDVTSLSSVRTLEYLKLNDNDIVDVSPLSGMSALTSLEVVGNPIESLESFRLYATNKYTNSNMLRISYSENIDWEAIAVSDTNHVCVYDVPPRLVDSMIDLGFICASLEDGEALDEETESAEEETEDSETEAA